jgi:hypothetical protein
MGTVLVKVPLGDGSGDFVVAEVDDTTLRTDQVSLAARQPEKLIEVADTLQASFDRTIGAVSDLLVRVRSMPNAPEQAQIQFGLKLGGEAGLIFARGTAEVNFQVTLSWQKPKA